MHILLKAISSVALAAQMLFPAAAPGVANTDAAARASGNLHAQALTIGRSLFATEWPAQVLNVYADGVGSDAVAGLHVSGVHFHQPLTRTQFIAEIADLVERTFAAAPVQEVDVWTTVPVAVPKGAVVAGDLAQPAWRNVFTVTVLRGEGTRALQDRLARGSGVFWDQDWAASALK